jgi:hypothetical protein
MLTNTCCQEIDLAVSRVAAANAEAGECLIRAYLLKQSYRKIERDAGIGRGRIGPLLRLAEAAVGELLDGE